MFAIRAARIVATVVLFVAGCGGTALGDDHPPASLDPGSPRVAAQAIAFDTAVLTVPADRPFTLVFENRDAVPHNISIYAGDAGQDRRFEGAVFSGPATRWYPVPALAPGAYVFRCDVHPNMTGRLIAA